MKDKYMSVITNFGCHYTCPYCIVKNNNLNIPKTTIEGLDSLQHEILKNECNWVSISGGGDPLWNYDEHVDWYVKLFANTVGCKRELHTSLLGVPGRNLSPHWLFDRVVYHVHSLEQLYYIKSLNKDQIVRVVFVVTENFTEDMIDRITTFCANSEDIDELSFRQMVDNHYEKTYYCHDYLKAGHGKLWWYIEQDDYNLYYCENKVYTEYRSIGCKEEQKNIVPKDTITFDDLISITPNVRLADLIQLFLLGYDDKIYFDVQINTSDEIITLENIRIIAPELQPYYDYKIAYLGEPDYESNANLEVILKE